MGDKKKHIISLNYIFFLSFFFFLSPNAIYYFSALFLPPRFRRIVAGSADYRRNGEENHMIRIRIDSFHWPAHRSWWSSQPCVYLFPILITEFTNLWSQDVTPAGKYRFLGALLTGAAPATSSVRSYLRCGCSRIGPRHFLSAAHCSIVKGTELDALHTSFCTYFYPPVLTFFFF